MCGLLIKVLLYCVVSQMRKKCQTTSWHSFASRSIHCNKCKLTLNQKQQKRSLWQTLPIMRMHICVSFALPAWQKITLYVTQYEKGRALRLKSHAWAIDLYTTHVKLINNQGKMRKMDRFNRKEAVKLNI